MKQEGRKENVDIKKTRKKKKKKKRGIPNIKEDMD